MTTLEIPAAGYSICYELGLFKQKIVDGQQVELPDDWKELAARGCCPAAGGGGGPLRRQGPQAGTDGRCIVDHEDYTRVLAVPCDMEIAGYGPSM